MATKQPAAPSPAAPRPNIVFILADQWRGDCLGVTGHPVVETPKRLALWRRRLVEELAPRTADGLSDGKRLLPGKSLPAVRPELLAAQA